MHFLFGFISSNRSGGKGGLDIYRFFTRGDVKISGRVNMLETDTKLESISVEFLNTQTSTYFTASVDETGYYEISLPSAYSYVVSLDDKKYNASKISSYYSVVNVPLAELGWKEIQKNIIFSQTDEKLIVK